LTIFNKKQFIKNPNDNNYHLKINDDDIGDIVFLVGDPNRVKEVSDKFESIHSKKSNREFQTHCGFIKNKKVSVMSTGIGIDNIEIVITELNSIIKKNRTIKFIRIGTCGSINKDLKIGDLVVSKYCLGVDSLIYYYNDYKKIINLKESLKIKQKYLFDNNMASPYLVECSKELLNKFQEIKHGITWTTIGFYAPQFRENEFTSKSKMFNEIKNFKIKKHEIINFEMESSVLYFLAKLFGHKAITICTVLANRVNNTYHKKPKEAIKNLINQVIDKI